MLDIGNITTWRIRIIILNDYVMETKVKQQIRDFLEGNGLEQHANLIVKYRSKIYRDVPVTLQDILEDFYEYLKYQQNEAR